MKYPLSNPVGKFLACENGVEGKEKGWELKDGMAKVGSGVERANTMAIEIMLLDPKIDFVFAKLLLSEFCRILQLMKVGVVSLPPLVELGLGMEIEGK